MSKSRWHSGPPPSKGWWPASAFENPKILRWFDGTYWSYCATKNTSASKAAALAGQRADSYMQKVMKWQHRPKNWPKRSMT